MPLAGQYQSAPAHHCTPDLAILLIGICLREMKAYVYEKSHRRMFVVAFFIIGQIGNNPDAHHKRVDKLAALYSYNRILFIDKNG